MEVSVYHDLIVTGSTNNEVFFYFYSSLKVVSKIVLPEETEPTAF